MRGREGGVVISTVRPVYAIAALILGALALGTTGCAAVNQAAAQLASTSDLAKTAALVYAHAASGGALADDEPAEEAQSE